MMANKHYYTCIYHTTQLLYNWTKLSIHKVFRVRIKINLKNVMIEMIHKIIIAQTLQQKESSKIFLYYLHWHVNYLVLSPKQILIADKPSNHTWHVIRA